MFFFFFCESSSSELPNKVLLGLLTDVDGGGGEGCGGSIRERG